MPELSWQIIPEEDSQHHVEIRDEEKEDVGVARDGIGEEDDDEEGADELDDGAGQGGHVPRPCRPRPDWLLKAFKVCVAQADPACQNVNWLPLFYAELQSFWFPQKSNFFLLPKTSPPLLNNPCFFCGIPKLCVMKFHAQIAGSHCNTCTCPKSPPLHWHGLDLLDHWLSLLLCPLHLCEVWEEDHYLPELEPQDTSHSPSCSFCRVPCTSQSLQQDLKDPFLIYEVMFSERDGLEAVLQCTMSPASFTTWWAPPSIS